MDRTRSEWVSEGGVRVVLNEGAARTRLFVYGPDGHLGMAKSFDYWQKDQGRQEAQWLAELLHCVPSVTRYRDLRVTSGA